jgi:cytochrome c-type biogenesis protein CcmH
MITRALTMLLLLVCITTVAFIARAQQAKPMSDDPELDQRVMTLSQQLRCLVCQNETLADSQADLAADLRGEIREQMKAGKSDKEIIRFLTARYGDFVLYNPPIKPTTYLLWFGPFILLGGGLVALFRQLKQRRGLIQERPLTDEERERASEILKAESPKELA